MGKQGGGPGYLESIKKIHSEGGFRGFYNGAAPAMVGSVAFRASIFTVYEIVHTGCDSYEGMKQCFPGTAIQYRVVLGAFMAGSVRSVIECPFEYAKVKG